MSYPRTASIYITDHTGSQVFHAFQVDYGPEWHMSAEGFTGVLIVPDEANLARYIAGIAYRLTDGWSFHAQWYVYEDPELRPRSKVYDCYPDPMGGVISDGSYLGWAEWLRQAIPKTTAKQVDPDSVLA